MKPEVRSLFDKACDALKVSNETRDARWRLLSDLGLSAHDEVVIGLVASGRMEELALHMRKTASVIDGLPEKIEEAAKRAVGPVAMAATKRVEEAHANLAASTGQAVAESAARYFSDEIAHRRFRVSVAVLVAGVGLALVCGLFGYWIGSWSLAGLDASIRALASRSDIRTVLGLLTANPDLNASIGAYCGTGSGRVVVSEGLRNCSVPLWLDGRGTIAPTPAGSASITSIYGAGLGFLNSLHPFTIVLGSLVVGVFLRKILGGFQKVPGVRWLTS